MQGLVDFASQVGDAFAILVPTFCYLAALMCFLFAAWGFWMQSHPQNPFFGRPWIPVLSLVLSGAFASFDEILNMALATAGSGVTASIHPCRLFAANRAKWLGAHGREPERDARQCCDAVSSVFSEFWRSGRVLRACELAFGGQRSGQSQSDGLRRAVRLRDYAD